MSHPLTRRQMLRHMVVGSAGCYLAGGSNAQGRDRSPNERLDIAMVGAGGQAHFSLEGLADQNIVALCDVDDRRAADAYRRYPKAKKYRDYRKMFDRMHRQIDAVAVCTPDHSHAPASLMAMRWGKHVYCEKPLTWSVEEARLMAQTAAQMKVATQMGTQGMALDGARAGVEVLRSAVLGPVRDVHVWTDRAKGWWPQGIARPADTPPIPRGLDWDLWLGPAAVRPYHPAYVPFKWRGWQSFGTGAMGDMGIHNAAMPWLGLRLGLPESVEVIATSGSNRETFPEWTTLQLQFPERGSQPAVTLHWYDGGKKPSRDLIGGRKVAGNGAIVIGDRGTLYSVGWTGADWTLLPEEKFRDFQPPSPTLPRVKTHHQEWVDACKGGRPTLCNFVDFASGITEVMLLGALAERLGENIQWNAETMQVTDCPRADPLIRRPYRKGWDVHKSAR